MNNIVHTLTSGLILLSAVIAPLKSQAEVHSESGELVVMEPSNLPEQAQLGGNSFFLHSDNSGRTYLYVEQQQGAVLTVFDFTGPSRIKMVSTTSLTVDGPFDFVRSLEGSAELVRFRDGKTVAVLDLRKASKPSLHVVSGLIDPGPAEPLGETGFLGVNEPYNYVRAIPGDYQVVDITTPANPVLLTTVKQVKHRVVNDETGTTFLLGVDGLTVIRRISVENEYKIHQLQMQGN
jgi:hypothetical protein